MRRALCGGVFCLVVSHLVGFAALADDVDALDRRSALRPAIEVIDGDTVRWQGITYRLIGYDTPEIRRAKCPQERHSGLRAAVRLVDLVEAHGARLETKGREILFGRHLARLTIGGEDVAAIAVREGWGRPYGGRGPMPDWCPR